LFLPSPFWVVVFFMCGVGEVECRQ